MLKKYTVQKICLSIFCLLTIFILYLFPKLNTQNIIPKTTYRNESSKDAIFLLDQNGLISRVSTNLDGINTREKVKSIINNLTIDDDKNQNFYKVIPKGTKLQKIKLENNIVYLDFSKEFLSVFSSQSEQMIEAIIYSVTNLNGVKGVTLSVDNSILSVIPGTKCKLDMPLTRKFGINKIYDITSIKNTSKTTLYYLSKNSSGYYYVPVTKVTNGNDEKIEIIIKELTSSPIYNTSLMSYLNSDTILKSYEILNDELILDFNNAIFSNSLSKDIEEEVTFPINLSIKDNYDVKKVFYNVDNEKIAAFNLKNLD